MAKWLLAFLAFYLLSFLVNVALGFWTVRDVADFFFRSPRFVDHAFAVLVIGGVFVVGAMLILARHRRREVRWLMPKVVLVSTVLYVPVFIYLRRLVTVT